MDENENDYDMAERNDARCDEALDNYKDELCDKLLKEMEDKMRKDKLVVTKTLKKREVIIDIMQVGNEFMDKGKYYYCIYELDNEEPIEVSRYFQDTMQDSLDEAYDFLDRY